MAVQYPISTLKTSGGTWSTTTAMNADVIAAVNAGLTGDLEIRIENGQLFSGMINWAFTSGKMNGYRITIHSDIVTPLSPGGVSGTSSERAVAITDSSAHLDSGGGIVVENLILKSSGNGVVGSPQHINESGFLANANRYLTFQNNLCYSVSTDSEGSGIYNPSEISNGTGKSLVVNNHMFGSHTQYGSLAMELSLSASAHADSRFANNHVGTWSIDSLNIVTGKNTNNNIYSYNGSNGWAVTGTAVNLTKVNPLTVAQVIQASGESIATMSGRDAHLQSSSPLIDQADQSLAPAYDIELKARG